MEDDRQLLQRVTEQDQEALMALYDRYANLVFSMALRVVREYRVAEEIVQDVFMAVWQKADSFDPHRGRFSSWLLTITRHRGIDYLRRQNRRPSDAISLEDGLPPGNVNASHWDEEHWRELRLALSELPPEQRICIELAYFRGMTHEDIAQHLDIPLGTTKSRIMLGLRRLRKSLRPDEEHVI